jgi:hypothetical protein
MVCVDRDGLRRLYGAASLDREIEKLRDERK